jgi:hypothetical protein
MEYRIEDDVREGVDGCVDFRHFVDRHDEGDAVGGVVEHLAEEERHFSGEARSDSDGEHGRAELEACERLERFQCREPSFDGGRVVILPVGDEDDDDARGLGGVLEVVVDEPLERGQDVG